MLKSRLANIDKRLLTILLIVFIQMVGMAMILPILPLFAQSEFGLSPQAITPLLTAFFAAQFLAGPYLGRLSDRYGRLPILIISQIGTALSFLMIAFAPNVIVLFAARILDGITGGNIIVAQAYITDITPRKKRTESLGLVFAVFGVGFVVGPALGGILAAAFGPRIPYIIAAIIAAITVFITWRTLDETLTAEQREKNRDKKAAKLTLKLILANQTLVIILGIAFVGQFAMGLLQATFSLYGEAVLFADYNPKMVTLGIGLLLGSFGLTQLLTQIFLLRRLLARFPETWLVIMGSILRAIGFFIFALITSPWLGIFGGIFFATGMGILMPPLQSLSTKVVDDSTRGSILGIFQSVVSLGTIISTAVAGILFVYMPQLPYWLGGVLSLLMVFPALRLVRQVQPDKVAG